MELDFEISIGHRITNELSVLGKLYFVFGGYEKHVFNITKWLLVL